MTAVVRVVEELVAEFSISVVGYEGNDLYTMDQTEVVIHLSEFYAETTVELIVDGDENSVLNLEEHGTGLHKLVLMD